MENLIRGPQHHQPFGFFEGQHEDDDDVLGILGLHGFQDLNIGRLQPPQNDPYVPIVDSARHQPPPPPMARPLPPHMDPVQVRREHNEPHPHTAAQKRRLENSVRIKILQVNVHGEYTC